MSGAKLKWLGGFLAGLVVAVSVTATAGSKFLVPPPGLNTTSGGTVGSFPDCVIFDNNGVQGCAYTTDVATDYLIIKAQSNEPSGTQTASSLKLAAGADEKTIVIDDFTQCAGAIVYVVIDSGTQNTLTEGVDWVDTTGDAETCVSLAAAIDALTGVSASCATATVEVVLDANYGSVTFREDTAACTTVDDGTDGEIEMLSNIWMRSPPNGAVTDPGRIYFGSDKGSYIFDNNGALGDNIAFVVASGSRMSIVGSSVTLAANVDLIMSGTTARIYDGTGALKLGTDGTATHSLATGDVWSGGETGFADDVWMDGGSGAWIQVTEKTETLTFAGNPGDATKATTTTLIPDGVFLLAVLTEVLTTGTNCASIDIGVSGGDVDLYAAADTLTDGDTTNNVENTAAFSNPQSASSEVLVTGNVGTECFDLSVKITSKYMDFGAL